MDWYWVALIGIYCGCFGYAYIDSIVIAVRDEPVRNVGDFLGVAIIAFVSGIIGPVLVWLAIENAKLESRRRRYR